MEATPAVSQSEVCPHPDYSGEQNKTSLASDISELPEQHPENPQSALRFHIPPLRCHTPAPTPYLASFCPKVMPKPVDIAKFKFRVLARHPGLSIYMGLHGSTPSSLYAWLKRYDEEFPEYGYIMASVFFRGLHEPKVARLLVEVTLLISTAHQDDRMRVVIEEQREKWARQAEDEMRITWAFSRYSSFRGAYNELYMGPERGEKRVTILDADHEKNTGVED
ncbi:hypothetical protein BU16DRAFT_568389 [Lophium mytilinum]|uniref:Uncharacterized protein n=1 Tax=Lophium mytilinum TaxID=390894 RepID=A0A6A6Q933_9PEZI|nr:hypothetical protein BU16DRAFT_568389 [Lophium mytilinum]